VWVSMSVGVWVRVRMNHVCACAIVCKVDIMKALGEGACF